MKRILLVAASLIASAFLSGSASAQGPVSGVVSGGCTSCGGNAPVASSPSLFSKLAFWKSSSCSTCGNGHAGFRSWTNNASGLTGTKAAPFNPYPEGTPGTLVFPHHQFVRSPRDFFMTER